MTTRNEDGPEGMNPADRCLIGSRGSGGPPMLNNIYNNTYQIVQTSDYVMIDVEMMHDARIVRLGQTHKPEPVKQWLGDSVGHWEGDTLVIVTRNWNRWHGDYEPIFLSEQATVTERFTRTGADELMLTAQIFRSTISGCDNIAQCVHNFVGFGQHTQMLQHLHGG